MRNKTRPVGRVVLVAGLAVIAGSALWLAATGHGAVRYSADHEDTVPMWFRWVPALVGIVLVRLRPVDPVRLVPAEAGAGRTRRSQALLLLAAAVVFAVSLRLLGGGEPAHTLLKLGLLLGVPLVVFRLSRSREPRPAGQRQHSGPVRRYGPLLPVSVWFAISYLGPLATPPSDYARTVDALTLIGTVVVVFLVNSLLEEVFYRRWLQTRWEGLLGPWPAIVLASLAWAAWHVGIQGSGDLPVDLASTFVNQGVQGLFLGYLWSEFRLMWPIIAVHGAVNAAPIAIGLL